jgi:hypothetical protein
VYKDRVYANEIAKTKRKAFRKTQIKKIKWVSKDRCLRRQDDWQPHSAASPHHRHDRSGQSASYGL